MEVGNEMILNSPWSAFLRKLFGKVDKDRRTHRYQRVEYIGIFAAYLISASRQHEMKLSGTAKD